MYMLDDEYLIKFGKKYTYDNFDTNKVLYFIIGEPTNNVKIKNITTSCNSYKTFLGI